jgi:tetratricopeptide (TPR) repeat protein
MNFSFVILIFAQAGSGLAGMSGTSGTRPLECDVVDGERANVWERAKSPALRHYCELLASGASKVVNGSSMANDALALAQEAEKVLPGRAAPMILEGRAAASLGKYSDAFTALMEAKKRDEHALDDPQALLALGRAAARTSHADEARRAYQILLPRASALSPSERGVAYDEAGMIAMSAGPSGLDEAIATFRQAERDAQDLAQTVAVLGLALALDRSGQHAEAKAVLDERIHGDPRPLLKNAVAAGVIGPGTGDDEVDALAAIGLEGSDPNAARDAWRRYAEHAPAAWADHARSRIASKMSGFSDPKAKAKAPLSKGAHG